MNLFRDFVQRHISDHALHALLGVSFLCLALVGQSYVTQVNSIFAEIDINIVPALALASKHQGVPVLPKTPPPYIEVPDRSFAQGESSREVLLLQEFLKWRGFWPEDEDITGYFGEVTLNELRRYQRAMRIPPDGIAGPLTRAAWKWDIENSI